MPSSPPPTTETTTPPAPPSLPPLTTHPATTTPELISALKLVADSIAQQRQIASYAVITHPLTLSAAFLLIAILSQYIPTALLLTTGAGFIMALLVGVRGLTGGYIEQAERIGWGWLGQSGGGGGEGEGKVEKKGEKEKEGDEVLVVVSDWGDKTIGALVLRIAKGERKAYVRAWTTGLRYRKKGIGRGLLEEGVRIVVEEKGCRDVVFDEGHASQFFPSFFFLALFLPCIYYFNYFQLKRKYL